MNRLRRQDRVLLAVLLPVWLVCFALFARERLSGAPARSPLLVAAPERAGVYPTLVRYRPGVGAEEAEALRPGDRLTRVGSVDLRGLDPLRVLAHSYAEADSQGALTVEFERDEIRAATAVIIRPDEQPWRRLVLAVVFAATAVLVIVRAPRSRLAQAVMPAYLAMTFTWLAFQGGPPAQTVAYVVVRAIAGCLWAPLMVRAALVLPEETAPPRQRLPRWPWFFALLGPSWTSMWLDFPLPIAVGQHLNPALGGAVIATLLAVLTRNYRRAGPVGRRQVKWVVTGVYLGTAPVLAAVVAAAIDPGIQWLWDWSLVALLLIPVFTFIAITRSNLLDIDRVISGAASYSLLVVLLALGEEVLFEPLAGRGASSLLGVDPFTGQVVFVGLLAAVLVPAERVWRPYLDRIFFAEGRSLEARVEKILEELFQTTDGETVIQRTAAGIERTFHPEFCAIYKRAGEVFEPTYVVGSGEFPAILADSRAIRTLETKVVPIRLDPRALTPGSADRGALPESGAALIVPLRPGGAPDAFVGIGPKRSGDVYTSTDLSLLSAVAHAASTRLAGGIPDRDMKE